MKLLALVAAACLCALAGCADLKQIYDTATTSSVPAKTVITAVQAFDATETLATGYIRYCTPATKAGCDATAIQKVIDNMPTWRHARDDAYSIAVNNNGGVVPGSVYDEIKTASSDIKAIADQYNMSAVVPAAQQ